MNSLMASSRCEATFLFNTSFYVVGIGISFPSRTIISAYIIIGVIQIIKMSGIDCYFLSVHIGCKAIDTAVVILSGKTVNESVMGIGLTDLYHRYRRIIGFSFFL